MVVPPAIAVGYLIYWKRTTEAGAFWGMVLGYATGLIAYALTTIDPSYPTTLIPLVAVPLISLVTPEHLDGKESFYLTLAGRR